MRELVALNKKMNNKIYTCTGREGERERERARERETERDSCLIEMLLRLRYVLVFGNMPVYFIPTCAAL